MQSRIQPPARWLFLPMLDTLREDHLIQQLLCNDLEALADRLPELPPLPDIRRICDRIVRITGTHFVRAENLFGSMPSSQRPSPEELEMLHGMHILDETHAEDLVSALWQQARLHDRANIGQLSYMLRCFFDGCRRAIALKESWIANAQRTVIMTD
jgi:hypothetical protein